MQWKNPSQHKSKRKINLSVYLENLHSPRNSLVFVNVVELPEEVNQDREC